MCIMCNYLCDLNYFNSVSFVTPPSAKSWRRHRVEARNARVRRAGISATDVSV